MNCISLNVDLCSNCKTNMEEWCYIKIFGEAIAAIKSKESLIIFFKMYLRNKTLFGSAANMQRIIKLAVDHYAPQHMFLFNAVSLLT